MPYYHTVDHSILLWRLHLTFGIDDTAHGWFQSYLPSRKQYVRRGPSKSSVTYLVCGVSQQIRFRANLVTRRRSFAEYWKYFVARFNDVHAFGYSFAGSERIWMKFGKLRAYCLELALTDFGLDPRRSESGRPCGSFVFLSGKQRTTLPISSQPNFTTFAHKT